MEYMFLYFFIILEIKGILEEKGYSIRLKKTVISKEEKQKRME